MKLLSIPILIIFMSIQIQANNTNSVKKNTPDNIHTKKKKDTYPGVEWKPAYADAPRTASRCMLGHLAGVVSDS